MSLPLVIITGASSSIGAAIAQIFSAAGYPLGLIARNLESMQKLNLPQAIYQSANITDYDAVQTAIKRAEQAFGPIDCLINNAGFAKGGDFVELDHTTHENMINVNLLGVINGIEAVLSGMRTRNTGTIINISSVADRNARPQLATYAATKAAIKSLSESLRVANAPYGIRVCNIAPAKILTPMMVAGNLDSNHVICAEDLAKTILWVYQQPQTICIRDMVFAPTYYEP